jgi:hypothetical protein
LAWFYHPQADQTWREHHHPACLTKLESAIRIMRDMGVFHRCFIRLEMSENLDQALMLDQQKILQYMEG